MFASFAILLNFPRHNKMKGMGQIVTWSVRDETLHCNSMIRIFKEFIKENPEIWTPKLKKELYEACRIIVEHEELESPQNYVRLRKALNAKVDEDEKTGETRLLSPEEQLSEHGIEREYEVLWELWDVRELSYDGDGTHYDDAVNRIRTSYEMWDEEEAT